MKHCPRGLVMIALLLVVTAGMPVRRSPWLEARRRSVIDRNLIRLGRSYPSEPSAADIREAFQRPTRRGNNFLRLGRSQPMSLTTDDLLTILMAYEDDQKDPEKRASNFVRLGRDPKFIRLGRTLVGETEYGQSSGLVVNVPPRKGRARDHFIRLGRDNQDDEGSEDRKKRSTNCYNCQS